MQKNKVYSRNSNSDDDQCMICLDRPKCPKKLECGHIFCRACIDQCFKYQKKCPCCGRIFGSLTGNQPKGDMKSRTLKDVKLSGYPRCGCIEITYTFPGGVQKSNHPHPGVRYDGTARVAYLPDNPEGREVLKLLEKAFDAKLIFTIGRSLTTGLDNQIVWNDIHHKTSFYGTFGYPDPGYLQRLKLELAAKGIV